MVENEHFGCWVWSYVNMAQRIKDLLKPRNENYSFRFTYCLRTTASQQCLTSESYHRMIPIMTV